MTRFWRWLTFATAREEWARQSEEASRKRQAVNEEWARFCADTRRMREWNRQEAWRGLADLEARGILTPTVKYRTLEWLTDGNR